MAEPIRHESLTAKSIAELLGLKPLGVEGGRFTQTWRSTERWTSEAKTNALGTDVQGTDVQGTDVQGTDAQGTDAHREQGTHGAGTSACFRENGECELRRNNASSWELGSNESQSTRAEFPIHCNSAVGELDGDRPTGTAIYALFTDEPDSFSAMHRLDAAEVWHHYLGDALHVVLLHADRTHEVAVLGTDLLAGQRPQLIIEPQTWMGAYVPSPGKFTLIGCTMSPGFVGSAYEGGVHDELMTLYPLAAEFITRLTRPGHELGIPPES